MPIRIDIVVVHLGAARLVVFVLLLSGVGVFGRNFQNRSINAGSLVEFPVVWRVLLLQLFQIVVSIASSPEIGSNL